MDNQPSNRVEMEMSRWRLREERFGKLFSFDLSSNKALLREKLHDYQRIAVTYKGTQNPDERFALQVLKQERRLMEKQLYPNFLLRLLRRVIVEPLREQVFITQQVRQVQENGQSLHDQVQRAGFTGLTASLDEQLKKGQQQFSIPVSYYVNEKERLEHQLFFAKNQSGQYRFEGFKTSLFNESKPDESRQHYFTLSSGLSPDTTEAYNLLSGRAINNDGKWMQLDLNDKDAQGNYRIKEFHSNYGYDLERELKQLPLKELGDPIQEEKLKDILKSGGRQSVCFIKDGKEHRYYIEANPQFKSVNIYDEHSRKVSIATAMGGKTIEAVKLAQKINEGQDESQSKRTGLRVI
ncbi:hypothetical protein FMM05_18870 [Flavobacterium zepuense]|uniref:Uncharacterized protein n=1 Tax=Flavobacterium zepuense TaxID=2593302 RepID=A0A552UV30_9FLAO|nr:hypothetical protein [Flavobacterium zepuense]TRW22020.1 hypothetical protein FMM05_18870 [Flavobacterium zepuense]